jgi:heat shock protein HslJ
VRLLRSVALLGLSLATACGSVPRGGFGGVARPPYVSSGNTWLLTEGADPEGAIVPVPGYRITLVFEGRDLGGIAACNYYGGEVSIEGVAFSTGGFSGTLMGCEPEVMTTEERYLAALAAADTIATDDDELTLTGPGVELHFLLQDAVPVDEIEDTRWELRSLIDPDGSVRDARPAELVLRDDGTFAATTPCRKLTGEWIAAGDSIRLPQMSAEGSCPEDLQDHDIHVGSVIGDEITVELDGDELTIWARHGGYGLVYRARS